MTIFIVGLGLIGSSIALGLKTKDHVIYGYDSDHEVMEKAKKLGVVHEDSCLEKISASDILILALYPKDNISFIQSHKDLLKPGLLLTDVSGTKSFMMQEIEKLIPNTISYTSMHPMAGKETSGFKSRSAHLFNHANLMIVKGSKSLAQDESHLRSIANDLNFGKIIVTDAYTHDRLVSFTSQLTHILAVCLMHADHETKTKEATGDSFRDLTRIAKINEAMWSELFLENKDILLETIARFESEILTIKRMISTEDQQALKEYLRQAKEKRKSFDVH